MDEQRTFVGRQAELNRFREILEDPAGQAIVIVGQAGMGKTWLLDRMAYLATQHPSLKCGWVRYEVTPTDSPDSTMALMMDHAFEAAKQSDGFFEITDHSRKQWAALFKTFVPKGSDILELLASLKRDPQKHTREQFLDRLHMISKRMPDNGRALFAIDPERLMCPGCGDSWRLVTRDLPDKIKFLFAQRPEDELITSNAFVALGNVVRLPEAPLGILATEEVEELVRLRADEVGQSGKILRNAMLQYQGHPYAIQAAMEIVKRTRRIEDLPPDPTREKIAAAQWNQVCRTSENAVRLFEAYAILEVAVPHDIVQTVSGLDAPTMKRLLSDPYLVGLLRDEGQGQRIYHAILADHVRNQIGLPEQQALHARAILLYRTRLKEAREQNKAPDAIAAVRLPEHVLAAEGAEAFVLTFVDECTTPLLTLGLLDTAMILSLRCRERVEKGSYEEGALLGNLAVILRDRGYLDDAMVLSKESERICRQLGNLYGLQASLGNQATVLQTRGDLDGAMTLLKEQERICRQVGHLDGLQASLGNQALILRDRGYLDDAMVLSKESERICRQLGNLDSLQAALGNQAMILRVRGDLDDAMVLFKENERICRQLGNLDSLQKALANQALILQARGDLDGAMTLLKEAGQVFRQLGDLDGLSVTLGHRAMILQARGDLDGAMDLLKEKERICRQLGKLDSLQEALGNQVLILLERGDLFDAMVIVEESERICRQLGYPDGLQRSLGNKALILQARGDLDGAMALQKEQERICRELGNLDCLQRGLGNQALIVWAHGDLGGAMGLLKEKERICRQLGNVESLAKSLGNQALMLREVGRPREALPLAKEAYELTSKHGYAMLVNWIEPILDSIRRAAQETGDKTQESSL